MVVPCPVSGDWGADGCAMSSDRGLGCGGLGHVEWGGRGGGVCLSSGV
jgi:hypothetical protein